MSIYRDDIVASDIAGGTVAIWTSVPLNGGNRAFAQRQHNIVICVTTCL